MKKKILESSWKYKLNLKEITTKIRTYRRKHIKCAFLIFYDNFFFMYSHKIYGSKLSQYCQTYRVPRFIASDVPIMLIPSSILLQILTTWPDPTGPQWTTLAPIVERRSCTAGNTSGGPPTINVSWPDLAAFTPTVDSKLYTYNIRCYMDKNCLSFCSGSHLLSTKILYEKLTLHIFEYACLFQDSNRYKMEWHLAMHVCRAEGELSYRTFTNDRGYLFSGMDCCENIVVRWWNGCLLTLTTVQVSPNTQSIFCEL